ncbi:hypothetical protein AVEN_156708-1, partial [Araneus ventricosus]
ESWVSDPVPSPICSKYILISLHCVDLCSPRIINQDVKPRKGGGRGGPVVGSRPWGPRASGPKPDSTEDPPCMGPVAR